VKPVMLLSAVGHCMLPNTPQPTLLLSKVASVRAMWGRAAVIDVMTFVMTAA